MNRRPAPQAFLGVLLLTIGVVALLIQLDVIEADLGRLVGDWWPVVIIGVGVTALLSVPRAWVGPSLIIAVGALLLLVTLDVVEVNVWDIAWPTAIILVGLALLTHLGSRGNEEDTVNSTVLWWGADRRTRSQTFRGGSLTAIMGGIAVDLREAGIVDRAEIAVFVLWGGVEIKVPPTWRVTVRGLPILGGWEDKTHPPADPNAPELLVHVTAVMGGADIKNGMVGPVDRPG